MTVSPQRLQPARGVGEGLDVVERLIIAPVTGRFHPADVGIGRRVCEGDAVGHIRLLDGATPVTSRFCGVLQGVLVHAGRRVRTGQPVAWLRSGGQCAHRGEPASTADFRHQGTTSPRRRHDDAR